MTVLPGDNTSSARGSADEDLSVARQPAQAETRLPPPSATVYEILSARDRDVAEWYRGAVAVLEAGGPDRFAQGAHGLREVMNAVDRLAGLPQRQEGRLRDCFSRMSARFSRAKGRSRCHDGEKWSGEIDVHARAALEAVEEAIAWDDEHRPARRKVFIEATRVTDGSGRALPESEEKRLWRAWDDTKGYLNSVAKHSREIEEAEFVEHIDRLDGFIRRIFGADAYREQRRITELIREAEHGP